MAVNQKSYRAGLLKAEILKAEQLYTRYGPVLSGDASLNELLSLYRAAIMETQEAMRRLGIQTSCGICAREMKESCCFEGVEEQYDRILLLINLLLGVDLPDRQDVPGSCFFVGPRGCTLIARPYFCVNYLCPPLKDSLGQANSRTFQMIAGRELSMGLTVERFMRKIVGEA